MRLGCSTYSFWHFRGERRPLERYLDAVHSHGFDGVEILEDHVETLERGYLARLKRYALERALDIYSIAVHNNFVRPSGDDRRREVEKVRRWIEAAYVLGAKAVRVNSGRWATIRSFDELMANRGLEPPLPGYSDEDAFRWVVESLKALVPYAADHGVVLALENHWGLTRSAESMVRILREVDSEWVRALMDTGNFIEDTYRQLEAILPYTVMVHAKTYYGGGEWYTLELDYDRIFGMLREAGFTGWVTLEYEGRMSYDDGVRESYRMLARHIYGAGRS